MSTVITAGNATNGLSFTADNAGTFDFKTGTGAGTTAMTIDASQVTTFAAGVSGTTFSGTTGSFSGNLSFNSGYGSAAVAYGCRAWVNFNGTGTVAIRASGNVSSITDNGTGDYTVNFTTAMSDANYSVSATCGFGASGYGRVAESPSMPGAGTPQATTYVRVISYIASTVTLTDVANINVAIFR